ncbi:MAG TPA: sialidase family protein, partial [Burkholderiaceae bacterium]|nr:sialidase family protein [Burkholderiaceae bacterium]
GVHHNDKTSLTADPTDANLVYAVWNRLDRHGNGPTMFARSTDGGRSWQAARAIVAPREFAPGDTQRSTTIGNRIVVLEGGAHRGALVNVYTQTDIVAGVTSRRIAAVHSLDKGLTWSAPSAVGALRSVGTRDAASGVRVRDGNILPAVAAGPDGTVWVAWQDARFSAGARDAIALARSVDGGHSWSEPVAINRDAAAAFTPVVHVRTDGRIGVLHFDLRSDTPDAGTLWVDAWLVTSADGVQWHETHVAGPFDMTDAPNAGGLFLGDYQGLSSAGSHFVALLALANRDRSSRSDVHSVRRDPDAAQSHGAAPRYVARADVPVLSREAHACFADAQHGATLAAMQRRVADWGRRAGAR